jgi:hypothetical protein
MIANEAEQVGHQQRTLQSQAESMMLIMSQLYLFWL